MYIEIYLVIITCKHYLAKNYKKVCHCDSSWFMLTTVSLFFAWQNKTWRFLQIRYVLIINLCLLKRSESNQIKRSPREKQHISQCEDNYVCLHFSKLV